MTETRKWSLLAAVLALALVAAGWFLLVAPKRSDARALRARTVSAQEDNAQLLAQLNQLKALAPELPKREADLAAIRRQIPNNPALPTLIRELTAAAKKSDVDLTSLSPAAPVLLTVAGATTPTTQATATDQLMQVPMTMLLTGSYSQMDDFLGRVEKLRRVMLVTAFTLNANTKTAESTMVDLSLTTRVYMVNPAPAQATGPVVGGGTTTTTGATSGSGTTAPATGQSAN